MLERRGNIATGGQVLGLIVLNLVFTFAISGISIGGHVGGLIGGLVLMFAFVRFRALVAAERRCGGDRRRRSADRCVLGV